MGYGSEGPAGNAVVSEAIFNDKAWVTDKDQYTRTSDSTLVELANSATTISPTIRSGQILATNQVYDEVTAKHTFTFQIKAITVPQNTIAYRVDEFVGQDTGSPLLVKDVNTPTMQQLITITGPQGSGGGGGT